jgi:phenylacetate-CoA ligase
MTREARFGALIEALLASNRFYQAKLRSQSHLSELPFTTKAELIADQLQNPPFGTNLTFPLDHYTRFHQTSGTSGQPMRWLDTPESWDWVVKCWTRIYEATGVTRADRFFFPFSFGPFLGFWGAFDAASRLGCLTIPGGGMRSAQRLRTILDNGVTALCCTPTYALHLAEVAREEGIDLETSRVRTIIVAGEPGGSIPATRAHIEQSWRGARVVDHHGMTEIGPVTYECPRRRGVLHVMENEYIPEVLDTGELVLTNLGRAGSPLIRYRTGDIVRRAPQSHCECGSEEMALEGGILSRADDMVVVRGVNLYPSAVEQLIRSSGGVAEFRVELYEDRSLTEMTIQIEPAPSEDGASLTHRVAAALQYAFGLRIPVTAVPPGTLPRFEAKSKRWVYR